MKTETKKKIYRVLAKMGSLMPVKIERAWILPVVGAGIYFLVYVLAKMGWM
jgi:hypothetical protein